MAKKKSYLKKKQSFSGAQILLFIILIAAVGAVAIWQSLAAPHKGGGGGKSTGTLTGPVMVTDTNSDGLPNWGDVITFKVTSSASWPSVQLDCYQNGTPVYSATTGYYPTYVWTNNYTLDNWKWTSGAADCTATLYHTNKNGSSTTDATLTFHVNA